ncbi:MAG: hypothetical protein MJK04_17405 [Psychrosphaera sp.]|nr:hypothetical protein [Psychrosphaera sp.]
MIQTLISGINISIYGKENKNEISKIILALGLGLGLSTASALPTGASCGDLESLCDNGDQGACIQYQMYNCYLCKASPRFCKLENTNP